MLSFFRKLKQEISAAHAPEPAERAIQSDPKWQHITGHHSSFSPTEDRKRRFER
jgi:hypothetical protein